jgi:two-component system, OmpR family, response regulator MprA
MLAAAAMNEPAPVVLVVEHEERLRAALTRGLERAGFAVDTAVNGLQALLKVGERRVDALVLGAALPIVDGLETCRRLRAASIDVPILLLAATDDVDERVEGLEAGADDSLHKPFAVAELVARVRAIMRRAENGHASPRERDVRTYGDLTFDRRVATAWRGEREIPLTATESRLLDCLMELPEKVLSRPKISLRVWGYEDAAESNSVNVYIGYLRRKLEEGGEPRLIHTVRSVGYVLRAR